VAVRVARRVVRGGDARWPASPSAPRPRTCRARRAAPRPWPRARASTAPPPWPRRRRAWPGARPPWPGAPPPRRPRQRRAPWPSSGASSWSSSPAAAWAPPSRTSCRPSRSARRTGRAPRGETWSSSPSAQPSRSEAAAEAEAEAETRPRPRPRPRPEPEPEPRPETEPEPRPSPSPSPSPRSIRNGEAACVRSRLRWCEQTAAERRRSRAITAVQVDGGTPAIRTLWRKVGGGPSECWGRGLSAVTASVVRADSGVNVDAHAPSPQCRSTAALSRSGPSGRKVGGGPQRMLGEGLVCGHGPGGGSRQRLNADAHAPSPQRRSTAAPPRSGRFGRGPQRMLGEGLVCGHGFGGGSRQRLNAGPHARAQPTGSTTALPRSGRFGRGPQRMLGEGLFESPSDQCCIGPLSRGTALRMKSEPAVRSTWK
jgi:hypothetical protein